MKKKVLVISYSYPPSNAPAAQRPYALAKYLDKSLFEVTVITCENADSSLGFDEGFDESSPGVRLVKIASKIGKGAASYRNASMATEKKTSKKSLLSSLKSTMFSVFSKLIFPDKGVFWYPNVIAYLRKHPEVYKEADILFTTSPLFTNHIIGRFIKKRSELQWISDFRDFHYVENFSKSSGINSYLHKRLEKKVIKESNRVTFISSAMRDIYAGYYTNHSDKMHYVYNGFDPSDFSEISIKPVSNDKLTIFYAGSFYKGVRSPFPLLKVLDASFKNGLLSPAEVKIEIAGNFEEGLVEDAKQYASYHCIEFIGRIPRSKVLKKLVTSDYLWLIVSNHITHYTGVPIKFYEYLAARRPILNFAPSMSEPTKLISELNLGVNFFTEESSNQNHYELLEKSIENYKAGLLKAPLTDENNSLFTRDVQTLEFQKLMGI